MFLEIKTAMAIVDLNDVTCCARCAHFKQYQHDLGAEWYCTKLEDAGLDSEDFIKVYKARECSRFQKGDES